MRSAVVRSFAGLLYGLAQAAVPSTVHAQISRTAAVEVPSVASIAGQAGAALVPVGGPVSALSAPGVLSGAGASLPGVSSPRVSLRQPEASAGAVKKAEPGAAAQPAARGRGPAAAVDAGLGLGLPSQAVPALRPFQAGRAPSEPADGNIPEIRDASPVPSVGAGAEEQARRFERRLLRSARRQAKALVESTRKGQAFEELERLQQKAFSRPGERRSAAEVEAARALIRLIGDPQLIVQSKGFAASVGLGNAVAFDAAVRSILQRKGLSPGQKALLGRLEAEDPVSLDAALPKVSRATRDLLLRPADKERYRTLPDESGLRLRTDDDPRLHAEVLRRGAGARDFQLPEYVRVRPPEEIARPTDEALDRRLSEVDGVRSRGPRLLSPAEAAVLRRGRTAPSRTLSEAGSRSAARQGYDEAEAMVQRWVARGEDLDLDKLQALSRAILRRSRNAADAGRLRDFDNGLHQPDGFVSFAPWETIPAYLEDFMAWYAANEGKMHPVRFAALAYQQLVRIHPFVNGNGRAGRLVMDFILLRSGYLPPVFKDVDHRTITDNPAVVIERVCQGIMNAAELLRSSAVR